MAGWLANKLRAGRFAMNLKLVETELIGSSIDYRATILVAAGAMLEKLQVDDPMTGILLSRAVLEPFGTSPEDALNFYNVLEDVLGTTEQQRKHAVKQMSAHLGAVSAKDFDRQLRIQQEGMRLLMIALARKVDDQFRPKARKLREPLYESKENIPASIAALKSQYERTRNPLSSSSMQPNYEQIKIKSELFAFAVVGW